MTSLARRVAMTLGLVLGLAIGVIGAEREARTFDLTATESLTLSDETLRVLRRLDEKATVTVVLPPGEPGRAEAASLLTRYRRANHRMSFRILDAERSPGIVRSLGVDEVFGGIAVRVGDRIERAPAASELDVTSALVRALRNETPVACFATGHGEIGVTDTTSGGLSSAGQALVANGYRVEEIDLLTDPAVPSMCGAIVMANPRAPLGEAEAVLGGWLEDGGALLVFADPTSTLDLSPLLEPYGLSVERGLVFEGNDDARLPGDPITPVVTRFRSAIPVVRRLPPVFFSAAQALIVDEGAEERVEGLTVAALAETSGDSYLERTDPNEGSFDPAQDRQGPVVLMAAADRSSVRQRSRIVAVADVDLVTNDLIGQAGHTPLLVQALDWLTLDRSLITVSPNLPEVRPLTLTEHRANYMRLVTAGAVPLFFLLSGALVWAVRRTR